MRFSGLNRHTWHARRISREIGWKRQSSEKLLWVEFQAGYTCLPHPHVRRLPDGKYEGPGRHSWQADVLWQYQQPGCRTQTVVGPCEENFLLVYAVATFQMWNQTYSVWIFLWSPRIPCTFRIPVRFFVTSQPIGWWELLLCSSSPPTIFTFRLAAVLVPESK